MTTASQKMIQAIQHVVKSVGIGTNLNLFNLLWAMVSGSFLSSRGTVHLALKLSGCTDAQIKRASESLRTGQWQIGELIANWREYIEQETDWERKEYEGWHVVSADVVVFPRLKLKGWIGKLYRGTFGKAIKAVGIGVIVDIGHYGGWRIPLIRGLVRSQNREGSEKLLKKALLKKTVRIMRPNEVLTHDAGATVNDMREAGVANYVIRLAKNCVARRNYLPENAHGNRQYGDEIRPRARMREGVLIEATNDPDLKTSFEWQGRTIEAHCWRDVVTHGDKVSDEATPYDKWLFLILCLKNHGSWRLQSKQMVKQFLQFILTAGLLNSSHWWQNSELDYVANMYRNQSVVGGYLNWLS